MTAERLGTALESSNLKWVSHEIRDIDLVTAAGMAKPELGVLLIRAYVGNDPGAVKMATWLATRQSRRYMKGITEGMRRKLVGAAITEFLLPMCQPCGGTGKSLIEQKWSVCPKCNGMMLKRYTNGERAQMIGIDNLGAWEKIYTSLLGKLNDAYYTALMQVRGRLDK